MQPERSSRDSSPEATCGRFVLADFTNHVCLLTTNCTVIAEKPGLLSLLCLYVKLHFKRQVHYLRLGVVILFTLTGMRVCLRSCGHVCVYVCSLCHSLSLILMFVRWLFFPSTGDLEDVICSFMWPLFCSICRAPCVSTGALKRLADSSLLALALSLTYAAAAAVSFSVVIVLPEAFAEILALLC